MTTSLVVVRPFATYSKGDVITDPATTAQILGSEQAHKVVQVAGRSPVAAQPTLAASTRPPSTAQQVSPAPITPATATSAQAGATAAVTPAKGA